MVVSPGLAQAMAGSCRRTAVCSSRSSTPGSSPSSTSSTSRTWRRASSASAWRPARASATARRPHRRSRSGYAEVSDSSSAATVPWSPRASAATARSSRATLRSSSSRTRSATAAIGVLELDVRDPAPEGERLVELVHGGGELVAGQGGWLPQRAGLAEPAVHVGDRAVEAGGVEGERRARAGRSRGRRSPGRWPVRGGPGRARARDAVRRRTPGAFRRRRRAASRPRAGPRARRPRRVAHPTARAPPPGPGACECRGSPAGRHATPRWHPAR